jgi:ribosomal protein L22
MAQERKGSQPDRGGVASKPEAEAKRETTAKRQAEAKSGAKPRRRGSEAGRKAEARAAAGAKQRAEAKKRPSGAAAKTGPKVKGADAKAAESKGPGPKSRPAAEKPATPTAPPVVRARARFVRVAPRKARLIADQVRGLGIDDARTLLRFSPRGAARDIAKLIDSAAANAEENHDLVADDLQVADVRVDEGPTLRRYRARALGRATRINKRTSHISVALRPEE